MKKTTILSASASLLLLGSCSPVNKAQLNNAELPVYEIAVRQVIDGKKADFELARTTFIETLIKQDGVSNDREFASFYALPEPDKREVFIGMTEYANYKIPGKVQNNWGVVSKFMKFKKTMDIKAYVFVQPIEGEKFNLASLASKPGQVLELAIRRVKPGQKAAFDSSRTGFVNWLNKQEGVVGSWELKVVGGKDTEGLTVGISVYENQNVFQAIASKVQQLPEAGAYFSTFDPVALQYAASVK